MLLSKNGAAYFTYENTPHVSTKKIKIAEVYMFILKLIFRIILVIIVWAFIIDMFSINMFLSLIFAIVICVVIPSIIKSKVPF